MNDKEREIFEDMLKYFRIKHQQHEAQKLYDKLGGELLDARYAVYGHFVDLELKEKNASRK